MPFSTPREINAILISTSQIFRSLEGGSCWGKSSKEQEEGQSMNKQTQALLAQQIADIDLFYRSRVRRINEKRKKIPRRSELIVLIMD